MDAMEIQPQDAYCAREATEQAETRALDDATFKSADYLEQTGDFKQAELIQTSLEAVMYSITIEETNAMQLGPEAVSNIPIPLPTPEQGGESPQAVLPEDSVGGRFPSMQEGPFEPPGGGDDEGDNITPINLPGPQSTEINFTSMTKEPAGSTEIPLPGTAVETGWKIDEGELQIPLASPAQEGVRDELLTIDQMVTRAETAMDDMSQSFNQQYLDLQKQMQDENRLFTMVSNIMKTKHDTAEKSINNIR